jgi:hypothetical protein
MRCGGTSLQCVLLLLVSSCVLSANNTQFGVGSRCIGRGIAMIEIFKLMAELCRRFNFQLEDLGREWHIQGTWVTKQTNMDMLLTQWEREDMLKAEVHR